MVYFCLVLWYTFVGLGGDVLNLKNKFLLIFLVLSLAPILVITVFTYDRYTMLTEEQTTQVANTIFEKSILDINSSLESIRQISSVFNFYDGENSSVISDLKKYSDHSAEYTAYDVFSTNQRIRNMCQNLMSPLDYVNGVFIFTNSGECLGLGSGIDTYPGYTPFNDSWYKETLKLSGGYFIDGISQKQFLLGSKPSISFSQALYDIYTDEFLGVLYIDCSPDIFDLSHINTLPDISLLVVEKKNGPVLYSNIDSLKTKITPENSQLRKIDLDMKTLQLTFSIDYESLYAEFGFTRIMLLAIAGICALVFIVISFVLSVNISRPITHLSRKMSRHDKEILEPSGKYWKRTDEIGVLYNEYNQMMETLSTYIQTEFKNKLITLDAQMKSLEAQINSHFLYNTLESINSIAEIEEIPSISTMSMALGDMFRYSIKTQSEIVYLKNELDHVEKYIAIQQIRFDNRFQLHLDILPEMYDLKILKLVLQPLVENALFHGLEYCTQGSSITITGSIPSHEKVLLLTVSDDGIGMSEEKLEFLNQRLNEQMEFSELGQRNDQSIGLKNIHTRLVLYYGDGYGLSIASALGRGTKITLKVPLI